MIIFELRDSFRLPKMHLQKFVSLLSVLCFLLTFVAIIYLIWVDHQHYDARSLESGYHLYASRYFMLYLDQSAAYSSSMPKVPAAGSAGFGSDGGALYFPRAKSMREKLHPGNMAAQSLPSWPALCAWVYVRCSSGSKENTLFKGSLQCNGWFLDQRIVRRWWNCVEESRKIGEMGEIRFSSSLYRSPREISNISLLEKMKEGCLSLSLSQEATLYKRSLTFCELRILNRDDE